MGLIRSLNFPVLELEYKKLFFIAFIGRKQTIYGLIALTLKKTTGAKLFTSCHLYWSNHLSVVVVLLILLL